MSNVTKMRAIWKKQLDFVLAGSPLTSVEMQNQALRAKGIDPIQHESERALLLRLDVTFRDGSVRTYRFYSYSERRCFMTVNDNGEFYVMRSMIRKLVSDADKLLSYQAVNPQADN